METQLHIAKVCMHTLLQKKWLVVYTRARWEKKVDQVLKQHGIECYCPVKKVQNQWADRKKIVELPLFTSYVFVRVNLHEQEKALHIAGVLNYVYYMGKPASVRDGVIEQLKHHLENYKDTEVLSLNGLVVGDRVHIKDGLLCNQSGKVVQIQGKTILMVLDHINCALVTRVPFQNIDLQNINHNHEN
jgi:transcriptional antiterminator RfaH